MLLFAPLGWQPHDSQFSLDLCLRTATIWTCPVYTLERVLQTLTHNHMWLQCGSSCTGHACAADCYGDYCGYSCTGDRCAVRAYCKATHPSNPFRTSCGYGCVGNMCAANCTGARVSKTTPLPPHPTPRHAHPAISFSQARVDELHHFMQRWCKFYDLVQKRAMCIICDSRFSCMMFSVPTDVLTRFHFPFSIC